MHRFWQFAKRMLRHRTLLACAMVMAAISASGMGVGIMGVLPVLRAVLTPAPPAEDEPRGEGELALEQSERPEMPEPALTSLANELNAKIGGAIPENWIDALPKDNFKAVVLVMACLGVLTVFGALANFLHAWFALTVISRTVADIRRSVFRAVVHLPLETVLSRGSSDLISRLVYDTNTLAAGFNALLSRAVAQVTKGAAAFLVALILNWQLSAVAVVVAPLLYIIIRKLGKRIRRASRRALESQAGLYDRAGEVLGGLRVVKVHTNERAEAGRFHKVNKEVVKQELRVRTARALSSPMVETLAIFVLGGLSIVAAKAIIDDALAPDVFILVLMALAASGASLRPLTGIINDIQQASAAAGRIDDILRLPAEPGHGHRLPKLPRHTESITFEHVTFTYEGAVEPALRDVNLTVRHGETVAFVGPNGSGKTTLLSLIPRLFDPDSGRVLVDGADISEFAVRSVRRQIGVVTQEVVLFRGTIESNVAYGAEGATEEKVREACRKARAEEFILAKPGGYEAEIGDDGAGLSGGQRQRLAIARAILRDPAILILDEATSMIDADSEARIAEALAEFGAGRTCLIVAHRLSTVMSADRIVVLDEGRIVGEGTHEDLLERCPTYQMIARNQLLGSGGAGNGRTNGGGVQVVPSSTPARREG